MGPITRSEEPRREADEVLSAPPPAQVQSAHVCLLGASFDTGNLGVSALAESSIKCILARWPNARVILLGSGRHPEDYHLKLDGKEVVLHKLPVRFCRNVLLSHHFCVLAFYSLVLQLVPLGVVRNAIARRSEPMRVLMNSDAFIDISGGDSFSDIYGMRRFLLGFLTRLIPLLLKKDLILFPQTYGPFNRCLSRHMARYIFRHSRRIYSRDRAGLTCVKEFLKAPDTSSTIRLSPDVAFLLDARRPTEWNLNDMDQARTPDSILVGLNVSGLIYYGGYTGRNEFKIRTDYRTLIDRIVRSLLESKNTLVVLVPHVIPMGATGTNVDNDLSACLDVYNRLSANSANRLFIAQGRYDHCQIKYVIGKCDFFIGTRMHSCIAALSQCIPAIGLAYSNKFQGVFETVGMEQLVIDLRQADAGEVIAATGEALKDRHTWARRLRQTIPAVKHQILGTLEDVDS